MAKYKHIDVELYKRDITVFIGSHDEFKQWLNSLNVSSSLRQLVEHVNKSEDNSLGSYWYNIDTGNGIIELPNHPKTSAEISTAGHEVLHCVIHMLSYIGIPVVPYDANESYTYLFEYIFDKVLTYDDYNIINI